MQKKVCSPQQVKRSCDVISLKASDEHCCGFLSNRNSRSMEQDELTHTIYQSFTRLFVQARTVNTQRVSGEEPFGAETAMPRKTTK